VQAQPQPCPQPPHALGAPGTERLRGIVDAFVKEFVKIFCDLFLMWFFIVSLSIY
jgi:hypothetical protein